MPTILLSSALTEDRSVSIPKYGGPQRTFHSRALGIRHEQKIEAEQESLLLEAYLPNSPLEKKDRLNSNSGVSSIIFIILGVQFLQ